MKSRLNHAFSLPAQFLHFMYFVSSWPATEFADSLYVHKSCIPAWQKNSFHHWDPAEVGEEDEVDDNDDVPDDGEEGEEVTLAEWELSGCFLMRKKSAKRESTRSRNFLSTDFFFDSWDDAYDDEDEDVADASVMRNRLVIKDAIDWTPDVANFFFIFRKTLLFSPVAPSARLPSCSWRRLRADLSDLAILPHSVSASSPLGMLPIAFPIADGIMKGAARYATISLAHPFTVSRSKTDSTFFFFASCDPLELPYT